MFKTFSVLLLMFLVNTAVASDLSRAERFDLRTQLLNSCPKEEVWAQLITEAVAQQTQAPTKLAQLYLTQAECEMFKSADLLAANIAKAKPLIDSQRTPDLYIYLQILESFYLYTYLERAEEAIAILEDLSRNDALQDDLYLYMSYLQNLLELYYKQHAYERIAEPLFKFAQEFEKCQAQQCEQPGLRVTFLGELSHLAGKSGDVEQAKQLAMQMVEQFRQNDENTVERQRSLPFILTKQSKFDDLPLKAAVDGDAIWWAVSGRPFYQSDRFAGFRGSGTDITAQRRLAKDTSRLATYDSLTGLLNRFRMSKLLESTLSAFQVQKRACSVMLIDLDRFKQVNDTLGHPAGDILLKQVAERLVKVVGDREKISRLGGDEFQIILQDVEDRGDLGDLADRIIKSLSHPYSVDGSRCIIGASVGVAVSPFDGRTSEELIRNADLALYAAKGSGRGRFRFYSSDLLQAAEDRRILEEDLRDALANGQIWLAYQPVVSATTNIVTGFEALIRWNHPERGSISPALFIPIAEETNLIGELGEWALHKACEQAAKWPGKMKVAVNVSPVQFANDLLPKVVESALASSGLQAERLELEITEGVFLQDSSGTDNMFQALKKIGVRLALDDFGTGYSSLGYLKTAPSTRSKSTKASYAARLNQVHEMARSSQR